MSKALVIVFVKNIELGEVKTRLAKTIGDYGAFEVYSQLVGLTENITTQLDIDRHIYFSKAIEDNYWPKELKTIQRGKDLGERMQNAFKDAFDSGYDRVVLIGSDLPDLKTSHILKSIEALSHRDVVFGPAEDGGYYLIGLNKIIPQIFNDKPWSQSQLLNETLQELDKLGYTTAMLEPLNDIDTYEDLIASEFYKSNSKLQQKIQQLND
jgi:rSAM/selenodomain-associated transferase 1